MCPSGMVCRMWRMLIRRASVASATGSGVRCWMRRNRLIRPTGGALHSGVGLIRRVSVASGNRSDVGCRMRRSRLIRPTGWSLHSGVGLITRVSVASGNRLGVRCWMRRNRLIQPMGCRTSRSLANYRVVNFLFRLPDAVLTSTLSGVYTTIGSLLL